MYSDMEAIKYDINKVIHNQNTRVILYSYYGCIEIRPIDDDTIN